MSGGGAMADAFVNLGDKLHNNINSSIQVMTQNRDMVEKYQHLAKQLEFEKDKFGLQFALQKLQTMRGLNAQEKQLLLSELTARENVKGNALRRQMEEKGFRDSLISTERKRAIGNALASGFAGAMKDNAKPRLMSQRGMFGGKYDPQAQPQEQQPGMMEQLKGAV